MRLTWQHLHNFIKQHTLGENLEQNEFVVGLSGGIDSITLLHLFLQLRENTGIQFSAVHVDHGLSAHAKQWQSQMQQLCEQHKVVLTVKEVTIERQSRTSLEQQARDARYQAIANSAQVNSILFTGHHQSDQMETFLLRLMRGSGLAGLTSMREVSDLPHGLGQQKQIKLARPLLTVTKQQIIDFAEQHKLTWVNDESNSDDKFDRNFVRLSILPQLFKRWPMAGKSINTATRLLQQDFDLLNEYVEQDYLACLDKGFAQHTVLDITKLTDLSLSKQKAIVRMFTYQELNLYPALTVLNELLTQVSQCDSDSNIQLKVGECLYRVHKQHLYVVTSVGVDKDQSSNARKLTSNRWCSLAENALYKEIKISLEQEHNPEIDIQVKWSQFTDTFQPNVKSGHKKVNKYLKEVGCPQWWRNHIPLVYINGELAAIADIAVSAECKYKVSVEVR